MANFLILICQHDGCESSIRVRKGDLPETCPICREHGNWRVALPGEYTKADGRLLRNLRIAVDE